MFVLFSVVLIFRHSIQCTHIDHIGGHGNTARGCSLHHLSRLTHTLSLSPTITSRHSLPTDSFRLSTQSLTEPAFCPPSRPDRNQRRCTIPGHLTILTPSSTVLSSTSPSHAVFGQSTSIWPPPTLSTHSLRSHSQSIPLPGSPFFQLAPCPSSRPFSIPSPISSTSHSTLRSAQWLRPRVALDPLLPLSLPLCCHSLSLSSLH